MLFIILGKKCRPAPPKITLTPNFWTNLTIALVRSSVFEMLSLKVAIQHCISQRKNKIRLIGENIESLHTIIEHEY